MLFRLRFLFHCICFFLYNQFLFSFLHFILCRMCVCHMFNKVLTYLLVQEDHSFLRTYKDKLVEKELYNSKPQTSRTSQNSDPSPNTRKFTDEDIKKVKDAVMTLLRRHDAEGQLCCCMDETNLEVVNIDAVGFVTAVKCRCPCRNEYCTCRCAKENCTCHRHDNRNGCCGCPCTNEECRFRVKIVETVCDDDSWTYEKIDAESPIQKGDHICWHRPYAFYHHAIVTKVEGEIYYINYSSDKLVVKEHVPRNEITAHVTCCPCCAYCGNECNTLYRVNYQDCYNSEYTVMRAEKLLNEERYDLYGRNCEHFSHYCKTGSSSSSQIGNCWTSLGKLIMSVFLKVVALFAVLFVTEYSSEVEKGLIDEVNQQSNERDRTENIFMTEELKFKSKYKTKLEKAHKVETILQAVYVVLITFTFIIYLVKNSASRLSKVGAAWNGSDGCTNCIRGLFDCLRCQCCCPGNHCCCRCIRSMWRGCLSIIESVCCTLCLNVTCQPFTCYRRQGRLVCGVIARICIREILGAGLILLIIFIGEEWVSMSSAFCTTLILVLLMAGVNLAGYAINACIGRWFEAICHSNCCCQS